MYTYIHALYLVNSLGRRIAYNFGKEIQYPPEKEATSACCLPAFLSCMHVCMFVCMSVCMYPPEKEAISACCLPAFLSFMYVCMCLCMYMCMYV